MRDWIINNKGLGTQCTGTGRLGLGQVKMYTPELNHTQSKCNMFLRLTKLYESNNQPCLKNLQQTNKLKY